MTNRTFTMIKPDATGKGYTGVILQKINEAGFRIVAMKMTHLSSAKAGEFYEVPVDEHGVEEDGVGDEDGLPRKTLDPPEVLGHDLGRVAGVFPGRVPRLGILLPPLHGAGVALGPLEELEVRGERAHQRLVGGIGRRSEAQHGVRSRNGPIGLDIRADVDLSAL